MGRKVNPIGFRLGINKTWEGRWYAEGRDYVSNLHQDFALRQLVRQEAPKAGVARVDVEDHGLAASVRRGVVVELGNHRVRQPNLVGGSDSAMHQLELDFAMDSPCYAPPDSVVER